MKLHVFHAIIMGLSMLPAIEGTCRFRWDDLACNSSHSFYLLVNNEIMASTMILLMTKKNRQKTIEQKKSKMIRTRTLSVRIEVVSSIGIASNDLTIVCLCDQFRRLI